MIRVSNSKIHCSPHQTNQKALYFSQESRGSHWLEPHNFFSFVPGLPVHLPGCCPVWRYFFAIKVAQPHTDPLPCYRRPFSDASVSQFRAAPILPCHPPPARRKFANFGVDFL